MREITREDVRCFRGTALRSVSPACRSGNPSICYLNNFILDEQPGIHDPIGMIGKPAGSESAYRHLFRQRGAKRYHLRQQSGPGGDGHGF